MKSYFRMVSGVNVRRPRRETLCYILQGEECRTPMLLRQMIQTGPDRALPHRAPLDRATPQLSQLQMEI